MDVYVHCDLCAQVVLSEFQQTFALHPLCINLYSRVYCHRRGKYFISTSLDIYFCNKNRMKTIKVKYLARIGQHYSDMITLTKHINGMTGSGISRGLLYN